MNDIAPKGIGGWLILPIIGLFLTIISMGIQLITTFVPIFTDGTWEYLTLPSSEGYRAMWAPVLLFELTGTVLFFLSSIILLILIFRRHPILPYLMVSLYCFNLAYVVGDMILVMMLQLGPESDNMELVRQIVQAVMSAAIWIPYFIVSERVKNTFVKPNPPIPKEESLTQDQSPQL